MTLKKVLNLYPDRVAVIDGDRSFTYAEIGDPEFKNVEKFVKIDWLTK